MTKAVVSYLTTIRPSFSTMEYEDIRNCVNNYFDTNYSNPVSRKQMEVNKKKHDKAKETEVIKSVIYKIDGYWNFFDAETAEKYSYDLMESKSYNIPKEQADSFRELVKKHISQKKNEYFKMVKAYNDTSIAR